MGNLPPKSQIIVTCYFHQVLEVEDLSWKLHIPSKIIPRYMGDHLQYVKNGKHLKGMVKEMHKDSEEDRLEDIEEAIAGYYGNSNFNWAITLCINSQTTIRRLVSTSHEIKVDFLDDSRRDAFVELEEPGLDTFFDKDFVILYRNESINKPMILMQKKDDEYAIMVSMLADLTPPEVWEEKKGEIHELVDLDPKIKYQRQLENLMTPAEFTFVLDRSYSMMGTSMETAKEALILFLHSLPPRSKFDVVSFGSTFESIFEGTVEYNQKSLEQAEEAIRTFDANLGGTEIFKPLHSIFADRDEENQLDKHVFLLTDGAVFDPEEWIELVKGNSEHFSVHTFGIGSGASTQLITECAVAGNGKSYFIENNAIGLERSVIDALCKWFESKLIIHEKDLACNGNKLFEAPNLSQISSRMFHWDYFTYYCIINEVQGDQIKGALSMKVEDIENSQKKNIYLDLENDVKFIAGDSIFKMFCKKHIETLDNNSDNRDLITKLSVKYQIPSRFTSFIGKKIITFSWKSFVC